MTEKTAVDKIMRKVFMFTGIWWSSNIRSLGLVDIFHHKEHKEGHKGHEGFIANFVFSLVFLVVKKNIRVL